MSTKTKTSSIQPPSGATIGTETATPFGGGPVETKTATGLHAPNLFDVLRETKSSSNLDADAMAYINEINRIFRDSNEQISSIPINVDKIEARVFVHDASKNAIILVFADTYQSLDSVPPTSTLGAVHSALMLRDSSITVVQSIVVCKQDYARAGKMAAFISNAFLTLAGGAASNLNVDMLKNMNIVAITAIEKVREYVRNVSPHAVPDRDDIGVLICLEKQTNNRINGLQREAELIPFLAITGYTKIMNPQEAATGDRFVAIPTITSIVSSIPNAALVSMALPFAADAFISQHLWERPYLTFRTGYPNLGNLIKDQTSKKPLFTDNAMVFRQFLATHMTNPYLAIDITEGRARPVGIDVLILHPERIMDKIVKFYDSKTVDDKDKFIMNFGPNNGCLLFFSNYTGSYVDKGVIKDTRYVDFLDLACKVQNHAEIEGFLVQPNQPQIRIESVRNIYPENTKSLYTTTTIILDANAVCQMVNAIRVNNLHIRYDIPMSNNIDLNRFSTNSSTNTFTGFSASGYGFSPQTFVPGIAGVYNYL